MVPETPSLLQTGVWLIPLIFLAMIGGLFLLVRYWKAQVQVDLKAARSHIRRMQSELRRVQSAASDYAIDDPEPFGPRARALVTQLDQLGDQVYTLEQRYIALQERVSWLSGTGFRAIAGAPYFWYQLRKETGILSRDLAAAQGFLDSAIQTGESLFRLAWEVALQAREVYQLQVRAEDRLEELRARGLHGGLMDAATVQEKQVKDALAQIPVYFFSGDEQVVMEQADRENSAAAHAILNQSRRTLEELVDQASGWEKDLNQANEQVLGLERSLSGLGRLISSSPAEIDVEPLHDSLVRLQTSAQDLRTVLDRPDIERLQPTIQQAEGAIQEVTDIYSQISQGRQALISLRKAMGELDAGLHDAAIRCAALTSHSIQPLDLSQSLPVLKDLQRHAEVLRSASGPNLPGKIQGDLKKAAKILQDWKALDGRLAQLEQAHGELVLLLESPELQGIEGWLTLAHQVARQAEAYGAENWSRQDKVGDLTKDLNLLEQEIAALNQDSGVFRIDLAKLIPEGELTKRLQAARALAGDYQKLSERLELIRTRLTQIQEIEEHARDGLEETLGILRQISFVVNSNPFLVEAASKELPRLLGEGDKLRGILSDRSKGQVEKKSRQVDALTSSVEASAKEWLEKLIQDTRTQVQVISTSLQELEAIAPVEESAVIQARRTLTEGQAEPAQPVSGNSGSPLGMLVAEYKRRSDYWQRCAAARNALADVAGPVVDEFAQAEQGLKEAHQAIDQVSDWLKQRRDWPPTSVTLESERQELDQLESGWRSLSRNQVRMVELVKTLVGMSSNFSSLADKVRQSADRAAQEMAQAAEVEAELQELAQQWQNQWYAYRDEPEVSREIRSLLDGIESELNYIRREYKRKVTRYSQVMQSLKDLHRKVRFYQVALDADRALDVAGNIRRNR
jgi:uncharacterized phage infection (PIP) family protein YhgE